MVFYVLLLLLLLPVTLNSIFGVLFGRDSLLATGIEMASAGWRNAVLMHAIAPVTC